MRKSSFIGVWTEGASSRRTSRSSSRSASVTASTSGEGRRGSGISYHHGRTTTGMSTPSTRHMGRTDGSHPSAVSTESNAKRVNGINQGRRPSSNVHSRRASAVITSPLLSGSRTGHAPISNRH